MHLKLVIVDDESWTREVIKSLGRWAELEISIVGEASDGETGLALIRQQQPDIVLTDVKMPRLDGVEMLSRLRGSGSRAQVVFISGYDDFSYAQSALRLGAADYLLKPLKAKELNDTLLKCRREALASREEGAPGQGMEDLMSAPWATLYVNRRVAVEEALRMLQPDVLRRAIGDIAKAVPIQERGRLSKDLLIAMYYDLLGLLQRHILSLGQEIDAVAGMERRSLVFSQETTLDTVLDHICTLYEKAVEGISRLSRERKSLDMDKVMAYVNGQACRGLTLEETADQFFVSREYLSRVFKQHAGSLFSEYVTRLRMEKASEMIISGMPLKDVHTGLGFEDQAHFYKVFKRFFGMTPGEMQKRYKN